MPERFCSRTKHVICSCILFILFNMKYCVAIEQYISSFDEFKIKEKSNPLPSVTRDLQYSVDYIRNPCKLSEVGELSPILAVDELQRQYKESKKALLSQDQFEKSRHLFLKMVLEGHLLTACLIRVEFGKEKTEKIIDKWISGYENTELKRIQEQNLKSVLDIAESAINQQQCRHWVVMATRYGDFDVPGETSVQTNVNYLTEKLEIGEGSLARIGPAAASITLRCLQTAKNLSKDDKSRLSLLIGVGTAFTYELVGGIMSRLLGHHGSADLLRVIAHELNKASFLERDEIQKRVRFLVSGYRQSDMCKTVKEDLDCIEVVEADFTMHTPRDKEKKHGSKVGKPQAVKHPASKHDVAEAVLDHPGLTHLEEIHQSHQHLPDFGQVVNYRVNYGPKHHHHMVISGDTLVQKIQNMDQALLTAITENKKPVVLKISHNHGNPHLAGSLLSKPNPPVTAVKEDDEGMNKLLAAFQGNREELVKAIKARTKLKIMNYLKKHGSKKLMEYLKENKNQADNEGAKESENSGNEDAKPSHIHHFEHMMHLAEHEDSENVIPDVELELTEAEEKVKGKKKLKRRPSFQTPSKEILDELKDELSGLHLHSKPKEYVDNTLVHYGDFDPNTAATPDEDSSSVHHNSERGAGIHETNPHEAFIPNTGLLYHHGHHYQPPSSPMMLPPSQLVSPHTQPHSDPIHIYQSQGESRDGATEHVNLQEADGSRPANAVEAAQSSPVEADGPRPLNAVEAPQSSPVEGDGSRPVEADGQRPLNAVEAPQSGPIEAAHSPLLNGNEMRPASSDSRQMTSLQSFLSKALEARPEETENEADSQKQADIKNILSGYTGKNIDENDMESVLTNLPGVIGQQVGKGEVNDILSKIGKGNPQEANSQTLPNGQELKPIEITEPRKPDSQEINQDKELSNHFVGTEAGIETMSNPVQGPAVVPAPKSTEIINSEEKNSLPDDTGNDPMNLAGVTEPESKPKADILNLDGGIDGIEGLDVGQQIPAMQESKPALPDDVSIAKPEFVKPEPITENMLDNADRETSLGKHVYGQVQHINGDIAEEPGFGTHLKAAGNTEEEIEAIEDMKHQKEFDEKALMDDQRHHWQQGLEGTVIKVDDGASAGKHISDNVNYGALGQRIEDALAGDLGTTGKHAVAQSIAEDDIESIEDMKHQNEFDKAALKSDNHWKTSHTTGKARTGTSYVDTLQTFAQQRGIKKIKAKTSKAEKTSATNDVMAEIKKQDAVDEEYDKRYYPSNDLRSPDAVTSVLDNVINSSQMNTEKKSLKARKAAKQKKLGLIKGLKIRVAKWWNSKKKNENEVKRKSRKEADKRSEDVRVKRVLNKVGNTGNPRK